MAKEKTTTTLLDVDESLLAKKFLLQDDPFSLENKALERLMPEAAPHSTLITPQPGAVVKTRNGSNKNKIGNGKVFLNLCTSPQIPAPDDISASELTQILESDSPSNFLIPMSIGQLHEETDKSGDKCAAYDVVVNPEFLEKTNNDPLFHNFFVIATMESIDEKYDLQLDNKDWTMLKNRKYFGTAVSQSIKTQLPLVTEVSDNTASTKQIQIAKIESKKIDGLQFLDKDDTSVMKNKNKHDRLISTVSSKKLSSSNSNNNNNNNGKQKPECVIRRTKCDDDNKAALSMVTATVSLPGLSSGSDVSVLVGEDRIILDSCKYFLDLLLPCSIMQDYATSHFVTQQQSMVIRVPIEQPSC